MLSRFYFVLTLSNLTSESTVPSFPYKFQSKNFHYLFVYWMGKIINIYYTYAARFEVIEKSPISCNEFSNKGILTNHNIASDILSDMHIFWALHTAQNLHCIFFQICKWIFSWKILRKDCTSDIDLLETNRCRRLCLSTLKY